MNAERRVSSLAAGAVLAAVLAVSVSGQKPAPKPSAPATPLIRMDWLKSPAGPFVPPRRDVFSPQGGAAMDEAGLPIRPEQPGQQAAEKIAENAPAPAFTLRYIGFSRSAASKKIVALVLIEGQAQAVEEGDTVGAGYKVAHITLNEIEIQAPDGTALTFAWAGAER